MPVKNTIRASKYTDSVLRAANKGYVVKKNGEVVGTSGKILSLTPRLKGGIYYYEFSIRIESREHRKVMVHQLQAYQKFGGEALYEGVHVRHLDGDSLNNSWDNIAIGDASANMMDKDPAERKVHAIKASSKIRSLTDEQVLEVNRLHYQEGWTNKALCERFSRTKSTINNVLNRVYETGNIKEELLKIRGIN